MGFASRMWNVMGGIVRSKTRGGAGERDRSDVLERELAEDAGVGARQAEAGVGDEAAPLLAPSEDELPALPDEEPRGPIKRTL